MKNQILRFTLYAIMVYLIDCTLKTAVADMNVGEPRTVRLIYFLPNDRPYRASVVQRMKDEIRKIQTLFAEQMGSHGYGETTFRVETDPQGEPMVHHVDGGHPDRYYLADTLDTVFAEIDLAFNREANVYLIVVDNSINRIRGNSCRRGFGGKRGKYGGYALVFGGFSRSLAAHELGHALGLFHDFHDGAYIMSYGPGRNQLSPCHAEYLSVHPYFNPDTPIEEGQLPQIELVSSTQYPAGSKSLPVQLKVSDSEGLHQVLLFVTTIAPHGAAGSLEVKTCRGLGGETDAAHEFDYDGVIPSNGSTDLFNPTAHPISVAAVDMNGNVERRNFILLSKTLPPLSKISGDNQHGLPNTPLPFLFVVQVWDLNDSSAPTRVAVTFTVTAGGGTLSVEQTETNSSGKARSTLTLGPNLGTNTVEVSVAGIEDTVTFNAVAGPAVNIPDPNFRAVVEIGLGKAEDEPVAPAEMITFTCLEAPGASIRNLTGLKGAVNLTGLDLLGNNISDISPVAGLTYLRWLDLSSNNISDISSLVANTGLGDGDTVYVQGNPLSHLSIHTHIPILQSRGVRVYFDNQAHPALLKISGDNQRSASFAPLSHPFVVEAQDESGSVLEGIPVTFTVTVGGGTLSVTSTTTDPNGRAQSTLTLGPNLGTNTLEVSATGIEGPVTFHVISDTESPPIAADVNNDRSVNIWDLVLVASAFGNAGINLAADVSGDGVVNILDLVLVAGMFGDGAAAPSAHPQVPDTLTATEIQQWVADARSLEVKEVIMKRGVAMLEQLLVSLTPGETKLLANYPNPFNPETWIPFRLAEDAFVTLTVYDGSGQVIRKLDVGYRSAATYESQSKAVYWDGKNGLGERVASGVYFYTLTTGDYSATRKMVILK